MSYFESSIERIARILAGQYGIDVVFEGNRCETDGKTIFLPAMAEISEELKQDFNGFLDHEVSHCRYTDFPDMKVIKKRWHKELFNMIEDNRVEKEMIKEYPGCIYNLEPLHAKLREKIESKRHEMEWPMRLLIAINDIIKTGAAKVEKDIEKYVDVIEDAVKDLANCKSTKEVIEKSEAIMKRVIDEIDEPEMPDSGKGLMDEDLKDEKSEFDKHSFSVGDMVGKKVKEEIKDAPPPSDSSGRMKMKESRSEMRKAVFGKRASIPVTTKYDKVTDHSGKGKLADYSSNKREVLSATSAIRSEFERALIVKENVRWKSERETGAIDSRSLYKLSTDKNYRNVFKEKTKKDTNNVAVEILIDLSGSMSGTKIDMAKMTAIAISEALKDIDVPFEVTGFASVQDSRVMRVYGAMKGPKSRFSRTSTSLDLHVFKDFDCNSLLGLEGISSSEQNPDGECVAWAAKRLDRRKEKRKILMVLSDGQPSTGDEPHDVLCYDLRLRVQQIKESGIEVIGLGIQSTAVKDFYPEFVVVNSLDDLPKTALKKITDMILREGTRR